MISGLYYIMHTERNGNSRLEATQLAIAREGNTAIDQRKGNTRLVGTILHFDSSQVFYKTVIMHV